MVQRAALYGRRDILRGLLGLGASACGLRTRSARAEGALLFRRGDATLPLVAATYDDCYAIGVLQDLEALLARSPSTRVTFFPVGKALLSTAREDESIWKRLRDAGHEIGYHTHEHRSSSELTLEEMRDDYARWLEAATAAWGEEPAVRFARPPYADLSESFRGLCEEKGLVVAWWTHDWSHHTGLGSDPVAALQGGDIGLLHPSAAALEMTAQVLAWLPRLGLRGVGLSRLHDAWLEPASAALFPAFAPTVSGEPELADGNARALAAPPADLRAVAVEITPLRPRRDCWSCEVQVKLANLGPGAARNVWVSARLQEESADSACAAELRWRLADLGPGRRATLSAREAISGPAGVILPAGRYRATLQVGQDGAPRPDGDPSNDAIGPFPFALALPSAGGAPTA